MFRVSFLPFPVIVVVIELLSIIVLKKLVESNRIDNAQFKAVKQLNLFILLIQWNIVGHVGNFFTTSLMSIDKK